MSKARKESCSVAGCNNKSWLPLEKNEKRGHVELENLKFHNFPKDPAKFSIWEKQVAKGRKEYKICKSSRVCSNHFVNGKPTFDEPNPTLFLTESFSTKVKTHYNRSPKKRRRLEKKVETATDSPRPASTTYVDDAEIASVSKEAIIVGPGGSQDLLLQPATQQLSFLALLMIKRLRCGLKAVLEILHMN
eukprot:gene8813-9758_t